MNEFYDKTLDFQAKIKMYASNIFKTYGRELVLRLEEYNLLQNKHNCIESSTAIGFVLEEFLVSKLEMYTHCSEEEYVIDRFVGATASESFDCFSVKEGMKFMVNVKAEKAGQANNALAAIGQLHRNYCLEEVDLSKEHRQDNRSWSASTEGKNTRNNGRLQISNAFRRDHKVAIEEISYQNTFKQLNDLVANNK